MHLENQIIQALTESPDLDSTSDHQWEALLEQYPAFNLGYYFLAKKQGQGNLPKATAVGQQAALHFNDIRWLDYLLKVKDTRQFDNQSINSGQFAENAAPETKTTEDSGLSDLPDDSLTSQPAEKNNAPNSILEAGSKGEEEISAEAQTQEAENEHENEQPQLEDNSRLSAVLSAQLADFNKPVKQDARLEVEREPLYKVDYFASQGIAILKNQDGFDKKVRRFTDWLKEMKQQGTGTGAATPQLNTTPQEEAQAAEKAAESLKKEPVWTESMAEVLINQGKTSQAREVYQKLSLLYPEKSTYFASKIELLQ